MTEHNAARDAFAKQYMDNIYKSLDGEIDGETWSAEVERIADAAWSYCEEHKITGMERAGFMRGIYGHYPKGV